jgi:YesN/AraC family two-component response regulator
MLYLADNGEEGIELLNDISPDIIVSDVNMPIMNGIEFCRYVKNQDEYKHIPVLLLTALTDLPNQRKGLLAGADDYLGKPFSGELLLIKINNLLRTLEHVREKKRDKLVLPVAQYEKVEDELSNRIQACLVDNFSNELFAAANMAKTLNMSERTVNRRLKSIYGMTFSNLLREFRLTQALAMLEAGQSIKEVAFDAGFGSVAYFGKCFKERFGKTPGQV